MNPKTLARLAAPVICAVGLLAGMVGTASATTWTQSVPMNPGASSCQFSVGIGNLYAPNNNGTVTANADFTNGCYFRFTVYCAYTDGTQGYWVGWSSYINVPQGTHTGLLNSNPCAGGRTVLSFYINLAYPFGHLCWDLASNAWGWNKDALCV